MRDSGVQWIGMIPAGWKIVRTKFVAQLASGHTPSRQHPEYWENCNIPWFSLADVWQIRDGRRDYVDRTTEKISEVGLANSAARLLPAGTVMLSRTASVGFAAIASQPMATTQDFVNWICGPRILPAYLLLVFRAMQPEFKRLTSGSTHQTIYMPDVSDFVTPLPSVEQQRAIVGFVKEHSAKIDRLIELRRRQMDLLHEQRGAIIRQAIFRGLDPRVAFKDSSVLWFGQIPSHWHIARLKHLCSHIVDCLHSTPSYDPNGEYPAIRTADVTPGRIDVEGAKRLSRNDYLVQIQRLTPKEGDIVYSREGERFGIGACVPSDVKLCVSQRMMHFRVRSGISSEFIMWQLNTKPIYAQALVYVFGATSPHVNVETITNYVLVEPPMDEQCEIAAFIRTATQRIDALISAYSRQLALLSEYRAALIHECVTGQRPIPAA